MDSELELVSLIAGYAGFGAFLGAGAALAIGRREIAADWLVMGTVGGGLYGLIRAFGAVN